MTFDHKQAIVISKRGDKIIEAILTSIGDIKKMIPDAKVGDLIECLKLARRFNESIETARKEITKQIVDLLQMDKIPAAFEELGTTTITTESGDRVTVSQRLSVSINKEELEKAYAWLRENGLGDIIVETVNAQTLSAQAKQLIDEKFVELPSELFKTSTAPVVSITATKAKSRK